MWWPSGPWHHTCAYQSLQPNCSCLLGLDWHVITWRLKLADGEGLTLMTASAHCVVSTPFKMSTTMFLFAHTLMMLDCIIQICLQIPPYSPTYNPCLKSTHFLELTIGSKWCAKFAIFLRPAAVSTGQSTPLKQLLMSLGEVRMLCFKLHISLWKPCTNHSRWVSLAQWM